jgi:hypothetical protein
MNSAPILIQPDIVTLRPELFSSAATLGAHIIHDCVRRDPSCRRNRHGPLMRIANTTHFLSARPATGTRPAGTCHLHQVGWQAQMTQLKYYPNAQIRQGADRDRPLRVYHPSRQTRIASIIVTAHAAPKIAANNRLPCDNATGRGLPPTCRAGRAWPIPSYQKTQAGLNYDCPGQLYLATRNQARRFPHHCPQDWQTDRQAAVRGRTIFNYFHEGWVDLA